MNRKKAGRIALMAGVFALALAGVALAQEPGIVIPRIGIELGRA